MKIGGRNKLVSLLERTVSAVNIDVLAELVMHKYIRRRLIRVSYEINELAHQTQIDLPEIIEASQQKLYQVSNEQFHTNTEQAERYRILCIHGLRIKQTNLPNRIKRTC